MASSGQLQTVEDRFKDGKSYGVYIEECQSSFEKKFNKPCPNRDGSEDECIFGYKFENGLIVR